MRIEARLERTGGRLRPVLFFPDEVQEKHFIMCYSPDEGHSSAARAYMRQCKKPASPEEYTLLYKALAAYFTVSASMA
jgi:hypothetical protein